MRNPDPSVLPVCAKRCSECLYSSARIVSDARAQDVIDGCLTSGKAFVCHKAQLRGEYAICRGFYEANPELLVFVLANQLGRVRDV